MLTDTATVTTGDPLGDPNTADNTATTATAVVLVRPVPAFSVAGGFGCMLLLVAFGLWRLERRTPFA